VDGLRSIRADDPGLFTFDGTRTWILGSRRVAVVDPGPNVDAHVRAVVRSVAEAESLTVALTHGHRDHVGAVDALIEARPDAVVVGSGHPGARSLADGEIAAATDAGVLRAVATPGHTRDHLCFLWEERADDRPDALFCGDLLLGTGHTTWIGEYPGCVADYLASLDRVAGLGVAEILPAHGPTIRDPREAIERFRAHREARIDEVRQVRARRPDAGLDDVFAEVYGEQLPDRLARAARASVEVLLHHVDTGRARG
jgi:glyoxylase-like metal-dependent hydrolase (beta-lactamase superfamily II)